MPNNRLESQVSRIDNLDGAEDSKISLVEGKEDQLTASYIKKVDDLVKRLDELGMDESTNAKAKADIASYLGEVTDENIEQFEAGFKEKVDDWIQKVEVKAEIRDRVQGLENSHWAGIVEPGYFDEIYDLASLESEEISLEGVMMLVEYVEATGEAMAQYSESMGYFYEGNEAEFAQSLVVLGEYTDPSIILSVLTKGQEVRSLEEGVKELAKTSVEKMENCKVFEKEIYGVCSYVDQGGAETMLGGKFLGEMVKDRQLVIELYAVLVDKNGLDPKSIAGLINTLRKSKHFKEMSRRGFGSAAAMKDFVIEAALRGIDKEDGAIDPQEVRVLEVELYAKNLFAKKQRKIEASLKEAQANVEKYKSELMASRKKFTDKSGNFYSNMHIGLESSQSSLVKKEMDDGSYEYVKVEENLKGNFEYYMMYESNLAISSVKSLNLQIGQAANMARFHFAMSLINGKFSEGDLSDMELTIETVFQDAEGQSDLKNLRYLQDNFDGDGAIAGSHGIYSEVERLRAEYSISRKEALAKKEISKSPEKLSQELHYRQKLEGLDTAGLDQDGQDEMLDQKQKMIRSLYQSSSEVNSYVVELTEYFDSIRSKYGSFAEVPVGEKPVVQSKLVALKGMIGTSSGFLGKMRTLDVEVKVVDPELGIKDDVLKKMEEGYEKQAELYASLTEYLGEKEELPAIQVASSEAEELMFGGIMAKVAPSLSAASNGVTKASEAFGHVLEHQLGNAFVEETMGVGKATVLKRGISAADALMRAIRGGRRKLDNSKQQLIAFKQADSPLFKQYPELKAERNKMIDLAISGIDKLAATLFSEEQVGEISKIRVQLKEQYDDMFWNIVKTGVVFALSVGAAMVSAGLAGAAVGRLGSLLINLSSRTLSVIKFGAVNTAIAASTAVGSRAAMEMTDVLPGSSWGDKVDWSGGALLKDFGMSLGMSVGISGGAFLLGSRLGASAVARTGFTYAELTEAGVTKLGFLNKISSTFTMEKEGVVKAGVAARLKEKGYEFLGETVEEGIEEIGDSIDPTVGALFAIVNGATGYSGNIDVNASLEINDLLNVRGLEFDAESRLMHFKQKIPEKFVAELKRELGVSVDEVNVVVDENDKVTISIPKFGKSFEVTHKPKGGGTPFFGGRLKAAWKAFDAEVMGSANTLSSMGAGQVGGLFKGLGKGFGELFGVKSGPKMEIPKMEIPTLKLPNITPENKAMLLSIFPQGIEVSNFRQQNIGNCYILSFLHSFKKHPIAPYVLSKMIKPVDGGWQVKFDGQEPVTVKQSELDGKQEWDSDLGRYVFAHTVEGQVGDKIMLVAHAKIRKRAAIAEGNHEFGQTMMGSGGGFSVEPMALFLGKYAKSVRKAGTREQKLRFSEDRPSRKEAEGLLRAYSKSPEKYILTTSPPVVATKYSEYVGGEMKGMRYFMDAQKRFVQRHSYAVAAVDSAKKTVTVVNPHDTQGKQYQLTYDEYFKYFQVLHVTEFDAFKAPDVDFLHKDFVVGNRGSQVPGSVESLFSANGGVSLFLGSSARVPLRIGGDGNLRVDLSEFGGGQKVLKPGDAPIVLGRNAIPGMPWTVSGAHMSLQYVGEGQFTVVDLGSTNGTVVDKFVKQRPVEMVKDSADFYDGRLVPNRNYYYNTSEGRIVDVKLGSNFGLRVLSKGGSLHIYMGQDTYLGAVNPGGAPMDVGRDTPRFGHLFPSTVSAQHVRFFNYNGNLVVRDLGSSNGTSVRLVR